MTDFNDRLTAFLKAQRARDAARAHYMELCEQAEATLGEINVKIEAHPKSNWIVHVGTDARLMRAEVELLLRASANEPDYEGRRERTLATIDDALAKRKAALDQHMVSVAQHEYEGLVDEACEKRDELFTFDANTTADQIRTIAAVMASELEIEEIAGANYDYSWHLINALATQRWGEAA
jgi:hypothetical protein